MTNRTTSCLKRGGSWIFDPQFAEIVSHYFGAHNIRSNYVGLRLVEIVE
jgi:hypothetical protein